MSRAGHRSPLAVAVALAACIASGWGSPGGARAAWIEAPGAFSPPGSAPAALARSHPAIIPSARVLNVRFTHEEFRHPRRALEDQEPAIRALARARVAEETIELDYGLGFGLFGRARFGLRSFRPDSKLIAPADGSAGTQATGRERGASDLTLSVAGTASFLGGRLAARLEGGVIVPAGSERAYTNGSDLTLSPFTAGSKTPFGGVAATFALARATAPVATHLHAEMNVIGRGEPRAGMASAPFPERFPLVAFGSAAHDLLDLGFAIAFSRPDAVIFAEMDAPLLLGAGETIAPRECPVTVTPGLALRLSVVEIGAQVDVSIARDDPDTAFDPHRVYPDWGLRFRLGTDLVPRDRDGDRDGLGDHSDRCPQKPEDLDRYADGDGCPDPDNDGDGIADRIDACADAAEDQDGFADEDGCPETDNDQDGLADRDDLCPMSAEDRDGVADDDGCPELGPIAEPDSQRVVEADSLRLAVPDSLRRVSPAEPDSLRQGKADSLRPVTPPNMEKTP